MATAPRTLAAPEPFDDVKAFLEHLFHNLRACKLTQALAPDVEQLLTELGHHHLARAKLAHIVSALTTMTFWPGKMSSSPRPEAR